MESQIKELLKKVHDSIDEMKTLYDIDEAEMFILTHIIVQVVGMKLSPKLMAKLLKAAAHFLETSDELVDQFVKEMK